jgi:hypothetical protein
LISYATNGSYTANVYSGVHGGGSVLSQTLSGNATSNTLVGTSVYDYYLFGSNAQTETIANGVSTNSGPSGEVDMPTTHDELWLIESGNNLVVDVLGTTKQATIDNWYAGSSTSWQQLESIVATDGYTLSNANVQSLVQAMATFSAGNSGFNPQTTTNTSLSDSAYNGALATAYSNAWHH